ncbi:hypothetical protein TNCV_551171 [Trichonephila clavipes]|nr:hypothetical protein TNCV_551171 [Trichonephila clavipes]
MRMKCPLALHLLIKNYTSIEGFKHNLIFRIPPTHQWYAEKSPGFLLETKCVRGSQTALVRPTSSHLKYLSFNSNRNLTSPVKKSLNTKLLRIPY